MRQFWKRLQREEVSTSSSGFDPPEKNEGSYSRMFSVLEVWTPDDRGILPNHY